MHITLLRDLRRTMPTVDLGDDVRKIVDPRLVLRPLQHAYAQRWLAWLLEHTEREPWMIGLESWLADYLAPPPALKPPAEPNPAPPSEPVPF